MCKDKKFPSFLDSYYWIPQDDSLFTGLLYCGILFGTSILHISNSYSYSSSSSIKEMNDHRETEDPGTDNPRKRCQAVTSDLQG